MGLADVILDGGAGILDGEYDQVYFPAAILIMSQSADGRLVIPA